MKREEIWEKITVGEICKLLVESPTCISPASTIADLLPTFNDDLRTRHVYVVDEQERLVGVMRMNDIVQYLFPAAAIREKGFDPSGYFSFNLMTRTIGVLGTENPFKQRVEDVMNTEPKSVTMESPVSEAATLLIREKINELPVVDAQMHVIGQINMYEIISAFLPHLPSFMSTTT